MYGLSIFQGHDPQVLAELLDKAPVAYTTVLLRLGELRVLQYSFAPLALDAGPLTSEYVFLEISRGLHHLYDTP